MKAIAAARIAGKSDDEIRELVLILHAKRVEMGVRLNGGDNESPY